MPSETPTESSEVASDVQRLHPASLVFSVGSAARRLLLPGLVLLFAASRGENFQFWLMLFFVPAVATAVIRYLSFRYRLGQDELMIREGIVTRNERHIPYHRIQNVDLVQNPLHRALGVAEVRLETAGGQKPEAVIRVLSLDKIDAMRSRIFEDRERGERGTAVDESGASVPAPAAAARLLHSMSSRDVALFGIISNQGMVVVAALFGLLWQADVFERWIEPRISKDSLEELGQVELLGGIWGTAMLVVAGVLSFLIVLRGLSIAWAFLKLHGFRLTRKGDDLRTDYGLLTRISKTIPRHRIQLVSSKQTFLHRRFGRVAVQVETAGGASDEEASTTDRLWLAPLIRSEDLGRLLCEVVPEVDLDAVRWQPIAPRAERRLLRRTLILGVLPSVGALFALGYWGLLVPVLLVPLAILHARLYVRHTGYAVLPGAVVFRSGWWVRRISAARFSKIQALELAESPFDRRNGMASLRVDTAGAGRVGHGIAVPFLEAPVALRMRDQLAYEAGQTAFRW